ncbi:hypothetical protein DERP_006528 [Dermatophagoides pteronyssinus]|uniref:Uncharacterized protein n=1 Tax=Dermatophagoides pteronyssinus TaxID=6956 RepID=A0ABQ8IQG4_DERPT|nr:hypothetical protein DERP_006528 [Dermatophagoides pteronyssinus]
MQHNFVDFVHPQNVENSNFPNSLRNSIKKSGYSSNGNTNFNSIRSKNDKFDLQHLFAFLTSFLHLM